MKIGFIGCGNMGGALARAADGKILLFDKNKKTAEALSDTIKGSSVINTVSELVEKAEVVFLGVKPNIIPSVLEEISPVLAAKKDTTLIISMAAGISVASIEKGLPERSPVIRIMPNTPAACGEGMILYARGRHVTAEMQKDFLSFMKGAGKLDPIDERLIDAASAVSGCGPAFVYMFIEALADGGVKCGLPRDKALLYAEATVRGAASLALETKKNPGALKDAVCSPGGTTIEGVMALENGAFRGTVMNAVVAAYEKTLKMGK